MIMKRILCGIVLLLLAGWAWGDPVGPEEARQTVLTFWQQSDCASLSGVEACAFADVTAQTEFSHLYIFSSPGAFVILSADDCAKPILAYSTTSAFDPGDIPAAVRDWLFTYDSRIGQAVSLQLVTTPEIAAQWELLRSGRWFEGRKDRTVDPLVSAQWGQNTPYNAMCPSNTLVGCTAVAMGQIMHYWKYPEHGTGSHAYTSNGYSHDVDFSAATYDYDAMPNRCSSANSAVATLLYHCGVAIETYYTSNNSTAYVLNTASHPYNAESAMKQFFGFSGNAHGERRIMYDKDTWIAMLKSNLDAGVPMIYNGFNSSNSGGHCFVCDGYDANGFFHFNWGLKGSYDGFFEIDAMTPSNQDFSYDQGAIMGLVPASSEGVGTVSGSSLAVYPNPTAGVAFLEGGMEACSFRVYDAGGRLVLSGSLSEGCGAIDLSGRPDGVYFFQLVGQGAPGSMQKIVKVSL